MVEYWVGAFFMFLGCCALYFAVKASIMEAEEKGELDFYNDKGKENYLKNKKQNV